MTKQAEMTLETLKAVSPILYQQIRGALTELLDLATTKSRADDSDGAYQTGEFAATHIVHDGDRHLLIETTKLIVADLVKQDATGNEFLAY